jgi:large subunit ribosomal protein L11
MGFVKEFNARTEKEVKGTPLPTVITVYQDKSFTFVTKTPPATHYIKQAVGITSGAKLTGRETVGSITRTQLREIAETAITAVVLWAGSRTNSAPKLRAELDRLKEGAK